MRTIYLIVLAVAIIFNSCSHTKHIVLTESIRNQNVPYKIKRIINYCELFDIVDAQKNDTIFRIISLKDTVSTNIKPLEVGKKYHLDLIQIYPNPIIEQGVGNVEIGAIDSFFIGFPKKCSRLYVATNLNGSFLLENNKDSTVLMNKFGAYTIFCDACKKNKFTVRLYIK
jgi:hypothetical protein